MAFRKLLLKPGVDVVETPTLNAAQISQCMLIRFYLGLPQKRGGWQQLTASVLVGTCSGLHGWADIVGNAYLAAGTEQRLEVLIGGAPEDITPLAATENPTVAFSTTSGQSNVTIKDTVYSPTAGDWINLLTQVSVGGVVLFGYYVVQSVTDSTHYVVNTGGPLATATVTDGGAVPAYTTTSSQPTVSVLLANHGFAAGDIFSAAVSTTVATVVIASLYNVTSVTNANNFVITAATTANASTTASENGGNARIEYLIPTGHASDVALTGYGVGDYGAGDYGLAGTGQATAPMRQWSLDNFGRDLIASPTDGAIYYWVPPTVTPAVVVSGSAPLYNTAVFVMPQVQMVIALGAETSGVQEPLLVRWCDAGDFTDWTPAANNQAGSYFIPQGSKLVGGLAAGLTALLWTDVGLTAMTYQNVPFIFGFQPIATGCGLIGQRAAAANGTRVMWLSKGSFFQMVIGATVPQAIECPVWDIMFDNADFTQPGQFVMGVNELFNEFELFFPLSASSPFYVADSVTRGSVKYNFVENVWDYSISAQLQRTAWEKVSPMGNPIGADLAGLLQQHEIGYDANGAAMIGGWTTGYFDVAEGEEFIFVDWLIPDFNTAASVNSPTISLSVLAVEAPNATPVVAGPFATTPSTWWVPPFGVRGRQFAIEAAWADPGTFNRLGALRYRAAPDGRGA